MGAYCSPLFFFPLVLFFSHPLPPLKQIYPCGAILVMFERGRDYERGRKPPLYLIPLSSYKYLWLLTSVSSWRGVRGEVKIANWR